MPRTTASMYDPAQGGMNGKPSAAPCNVPVGRLPWSVAHKFAPCGSIVTITPHGGKGPIIETVVADRGPYIHGRDLDLRPDVANALGGGGLIDVDYSISPHRVNLSKMADAGGTAAAFEQVSGKVAHSGDPLGKATDEQAAKDAKENALRIPVLSGIGDGIDAVAAVLAKIVGALFDPSTYLRLGKGALGGVFVILGVGSLVFIVANKVSGGNATKAAAAALI